VNAWSVQLRLTKTELPLELIQSRRGNKVTMDYACPVCGYAGLYDPPEPDDPTHFESQEICPSCGTQLGYQDHAVDAATRALRHQKLRAAWIAGGMRWWSTGGRQPSLDWDPGAQLRAIGVAAESFGGAEA